MSTATLQRPARSDGDLAAERAWSVGRGQHVQVVRPGFRRRTMEAIVVGGGLTAADDDQNGFEFELTIALEGAMDRPITVSSAMARSLTLVSHGVYRQRGRPLSMWLNVRAELELPELCAFTRNGEIVVLADLNLNPTTPSSATQPVS